MAAEDLQQLRELVEFLKANGIAEFDMERTDLKVRLKFAGLQPPAAPAMDLSHLASAIAAQSAAPAVAARSAGSGSCDVAGSDPGSCGGSGG